MAKPSLSEPWDTPRSAKSDSWSKCDTWKKSTPKSQKSTAEKEELSPEEAQTKVLNKAISSLEAIVHQVSSAQNQSEINAEEIKHYKVRVVELKEQRPDLKPIKDKIATLESAKETAEKNVKTAEGKIEQVSQALEEAQEEWRVHHEELQ